MQKKKKKKFQFPLKAVIISDLCFCAKNYNIYILQLWVVIIQLKIDHPDGSSYIIHMYLFVHMLHTCICCTATLSYITQLFLIGRYYKIMLFKLLKVSWQESVYVRSYVINFPDGIC